MSLRAEDVTAPSSYRSGRAFLLRALQSTTARELASRLDVTPAAVSLWASGKRRPSHGARLGLYREIGIPLTLEW